MQFVHICICFFVTVHLMIIKIDCIAAQHSSEGKLIFCPIIQFSRKTVRKHFDYTATQQLYKTTSTSDSEKELNMQGQPVS